MTAPFPHAYEVAIKAKPRQPIHVVAAPRPEIIAGPPPQFDGSEAWWSPEHLLVSAAALCFALTFEAFARRAQLEYDSLDCDARGTLDKAEDGFRFVGIVLTATLKTSPEDADRARRVLESAKTHCIVANSLKAPVRLEIVSLTSVSAPRGAQH